MTRDKLKQNYAAKSNHLKQVSIWPHDTDYPSKMGWCVQVFMRIICWAKSAESLCEFLQFPLPSTLF